jgi:hypothetical protein
MEYSTTQWSDKLLEEAIVFNCKKPAAGQVLVGNLG